jgi:hypothetical protein
VSSTRLRTRLMKVQTDVAGGAPAPPKLASPGRTARAAPQTGQALVPPPLSLQQLGRLFPKWRPAAETVLRQARLDVPRSVLRDSTREVWSWLGQRRLSSLTAAEVAELTDFVRQRMLAVSQTVDRELFQAASRRAATVLGQQRAAVQLVTVPAPQGRWVFLVPSGRQDLVVAEAFAPDVPGAPVPPRPALPGVASPRWVLNEAGTLSPPDTPPPPPASPPRLPTGLPPQTLQQAPGMLIDVLTQAERRRLGLSSGTISGSPVQFGPGVPPQMRRAFGGGIRAVDYRTMGGKRIQVTITGRTRDTAARLGDESVLPEVIDVFGPDSGMARLHLWGSVLGDTVTAGIAYGPVALNQAMKDLELILKTGGLGGYRAVDVTVSAIIEMRPVKGVDQPFLLRATYQWNDGRGNPVTFSVGLDDVTGEVYIRRGLGESENLRPLIQSLRRGR